jgi:hypothetical protein
MKKVFVLIIILLSAFLIGFCRASDFTEITASNTTVGSEVTLSLNITDTDGIDYVIPSWNNTGLWINQTALDAEDATDYVANFAGTWNTTKDYVVSAKFYSNDTLGNMEASEQYNFTLTQATYTVTFSKDISSPLLGQTVNFVVHPLRNGITITDVVCNVTVDGDAYLSNVTDRCFTYTESSPTSHNFSISELYDAEYGYAVDFTVTELSVAWIYPSGGGSSSSTLPEDNSTLPEETPQPWLPEIPEVTQHDLAVAAFVGIVAVAVVLGGKVQPSKKSKKTKVPKTSRR